MAVSQKMLQWCHLWMLVPGTWQPLSKLQEFFKEGNSQPSYCWSSHQINYIRKIENELIKFHPGKLSYLTSYSFMFCCYNSNFSCHSKFFYQSTKQIKSMIDSKITKLFSFSIASWLHFILYCFACTQNLFCRKLDLDFVQHFYDGHCFKWNF